MLKGNRNAHGRRLLTRLKACLPEGIFTTIVADRGFGSRGMFALLEAELDFAYLIRFKGNILVGHQGEEMVSASQWLTPSGLTRTLKDIDMTKAHHPVARIYCSQKSGMKSAWFLASNRTDLSTAKARAMYGKRWRIETSFRDIKDDRFGLGHVRINTETGHFCSARWLSCY